MSPLLGRHYLECRCDVPIGANRSLAEGQNRPAREIPGGWFGPFGGVVALYVGKQDRKDLDYTDKVGSPAFSPAKFEAIPSSALNPG